MKVQLALRITLAGHPVIFLQEFSRLPAAPLRLGEDSVVDRAAFA